MDWSFDYLQRDGDKEPDGRTWLFDQKGGSVYLRLTTRPIEQIGLKARDDDAFKKGVIDGGYWLRPPGANADVIIAYQGCIAPEVIEAAGRIGNDRRDIGVLAITSADRLNSGWNAARRARAKGHADATSQIERLMADVPRHATIITVTDGHPATLAWIGGVRGHPVAPLGVDKFGQTGTVDDLYRHFQIDADAIVSAANFLTPGKAIRLRAIS